MKKIAVSLQFKLAGHDVPVISAPMVADVIEGSGGDLTTLQVSGLPPDQLATLLKDVEKVLVHGDGATAGEAAFSNADVVLRGIDVIATVTKKFGRLADTPWPAFDAGAIQRLIDKG